MRDLEIYDISETDSVAEQQRAGTLHRYFIFSAQADLRELYLTIKHFAETAARAWKKAHGETESRHRPYNPFEDDIDGIDIDECCAC